MGKPKRLPVALTIAGSDSGGGAGIQADLKTFSALEVHGTSVVTCVTAQNPRAVRGIHPCPPAFVHDQLEAVFSELPPQAVKTGMLFSGALVRTVARFLSRRRGIPLVLDPVMVSTSGTRLLKPAAVEILLSELAPLATLVMPNMEEAELLAGEKLRTEEDLRTAARSIHALLGCAVLVKGGHLRAGRDAVDVLYDGKHELQMAAPYIRGIRTHGTGCTFSAAVTSFLAKGLPLPEAAHQAKGYITNAIAQHYLAAGHAVLNHRIETLAQK